MVKMYCWCRKSKNGRMIGCDECNEWFHYKCVGIKTSDDLTGPWYCFVCVRVRAITESLLARISKLESNVEVENEEKIVKENESRLLLQQLEDAQQKLLAANQQISILEEKLTFNSNEAENKSNMLKERLQRAEENVLAATKEMELLKEKVKSTSKEADETILILERKLQEAEAKLISANNEIKSLGTKHVKEIKLLNNKLISKSEEIEKLKLKAGNQMKSQRSLSLSSSQKVKKSQVSQYQLTSQAGRKTRDERSDDEMSDDAFQPKKSRRD